MVDIVDALKSSAQKLHRQAQSSDAAAMARLRVLKNLRQLDDEAFPTAVKRRHCLTTLAREMGFSGWPQAVQVLSGKADGDFGTLLCPPRCTAHWNVWSADYDEAASIRAETGGYLLAYRNQFVVVDAHYIRTLGLDPDDPDWEKIRRDWARPGDSAARRRLYAKLIAKALDG